MKKKRPRIKFPRQMGAINTADVNQFLHDVMFPRTPEESVAILNAESDNSVLWKTQKLSVAEIIERYPLTEEQKLKLKEHEAKFKTESGLQTGSIEEKEEKS